jgi:DNA modification methylase
MVKNQIITEQYAIYESDCNYVLPTLKDRSADLVIYSPPFRGLFHYSSSENDLSNCETPQQFLQQYEFVVKELARVTKKGRVNAVHVAEIVDNKGKSIDFPHEVIALHEKHGFEYHGRITVWKEPLKVRMRTMVQSLMHKFIVEDAVRCFPAMPDYILLFTNAGENEVPVTHPFGLTHYAGETPLLADHIETYGSFEALKRKYDGWQDPQTNKLSHIIWQRYASSVWDDVRIDNVLPFRDAKDEDDEKHLHALQLDVIDRLVELYSNPNEVVLTPFMGVGSEVYSPVSMSRKAIGVELKPSYFKQAIENLKFAGTRFKKIQQQLEFA